MVVGNQMSMDQQDWDNAITALRQIQLDDVGQLLAYPDWWQFKRDRLKFYEQADENMRAQIWRLIERRLPRRANLPGNDFVGQFHEAQQTIVDPENLPDWVKW